MKNLENLVERPTPYTR